MSEYSLQLFVTGTSARAEAAIRDTERLCAELFGGRSRLKIVDVRKEPQLAEEHNILATPSLVKVSPGPARRVVGDFSDVEKVAAGLGLSGRTRASHP